MKEELIAELEKEIQPDKIAVNEPTFGIAPGKYGEGDILLAISIPVLRKICKKYKQMPAGDIVELLHSPIHEYRFAALVLLRLQYSKRNDNSKELYLANLEGVNNWDLVDESAPNILGRWCFENKDENILIDLHDHKDNLWHKRISIVAYLYFYRKHSLGHGMEVIDDLLYDEHPLIQKACGWMLRNIYNNVDKHMVESYIIDHYDQIPRNALRAAIESMPEEQRLKFLHKEF